MRSFQKLWKPAPAKIKETEEATQLEIGVFCGTFNPVHLGHLLIAECARDQLKLDKVIFVTSPSPPHREDELLDGRARHELVKAAVADNPCFEASSIELERQGPSYTYDTISALGSIYGDGTNINLIIGGDNLSQLKDWYEVDKLLKSCRILVVPRLRYIENTDGSLVRIGEEPDKLKEEFPDVRIEIIDFPGIAISGSKIRERLSQNKSILYMVPNPVNDLILKNGYFKAKLKT